MQEKKYKRCIVLFAVLIALSGAALHIYYCPGLARAAVRTKSLKIKGQDKGYLIDKKEKKKLRLQVKPSGISGKKIKWKSSKKSVVSVTQKGVIKGKKYGTAYITAKAVDGSRKKAKIRIQVGRKVKKVQLSAKDMALDLNTQTTLSAAVTPVDATEGTVKYKSSNKKVVSVSQSGVVKARSKGTAVITVSSTDGTNKKAVCKVTVRIPSQAVSLDAEDLPVRVPVGGTVEIDASVKPSNASNKAVNYISSNPKVAKVSKTGTVTGLREGTITLKAKAADGRSSASVKVEVYEMEVRDKKMIAHRGYSSKAPENTLPAFRLAVESGFWGVECDVHKTWDGQFVVMHDDNLARMCGYNVKIEALTLKEIKEFPIIAGAKISSYPGLQVPSLEEYLAVMAGNSKVHPVIELKDVYTEEELGEIVDLVRDYGLLERTLFISIYQTNLIALQNMEILKEGQLQYVYGAEEVNRVVEIDEATVDWCIEHKIDLDARYNLLTKSAVSRLHKDGRLVNAWTVDELADAYMMFHDYKIDMLTTEKMLAR